MPEQILDDINKNKDTEICINEIRGFSRDEINTPKIKDALQEKEKSDLLSSLENSLKKAIDDILEKKKWEETDLLIVNLWNILLGEEDGEKLKEVQKALEKKIDTMSTEVNKKIATWWNDNKYEKYDIQLVQVYANLCFDEALQVDGIRMNDEKNWAGDAFYPSKWTENQKWTNYYIYRQELITRAQVVNINKEEFEQLLDIPNLSELLEPLGDMNKQNEVFWKFLDFFLEIKRRGLYFETLIGGENIQTVLNYMILAETDKDVTVEEYFKKFKEEFAETIEFKELIIQWWYKNMYEYYDAMAKEYEAVTIDQFVEYIADPEEKAQTKKSLEDAWYATIGQYYNDLLLTVSEEPDKSMSVEEYFKGQEEMGKEHIESQANIKETTMGEYYTNQSIALQTEIIQANNINVVNNKKLDEEIKRNERIQTAWTELLWLMKQEETLKKSMKNIWQIMKIE
jgi:hypothetical protein